MKKGKISSRITELELVAGLLFFMLGVVAIFEPYFRLDLQITQFIQGINLTGFSSLMWFVSSLGNNYFIEIIVILTALFLYKFANMTAMIVSLLGVLGSVLLGMLFKLIVHRPRPDVSLVRVWVNLADKSFPSLHVVIFTSFFGFLLYLSLYVIKNRFLGLIVGTISSFMILTVGISRIYLGAHWASDVLGGYLLGTICLLLTIQAYRKLAH